MCIRDSTYSELFEHADWALYHAKRQGKDCYEFYRPGMVTDRHWQETRDQAPEREAPLSLNDDVVAYIFSILYESRDVVSAVELILSIVGKRFDVSRAYIFENTPDDMYCSNTFEWCNEGIEPQQNHLQRVPYAMLGDYPSNFNEEGIFYCTDIHSLAPEIYAILAPQNIHAMLQCAILYEGKFSGYVGFDECNSHRYWTREEVEALTFISQLLSTFLIKERIQRRLSEAFAITQSVLDLSLIHICSPGGWGWRRTSASRRWMPVCRPKRWKPTARPFVWGMGPNDNAINLLSRGDCP